MAKDYWQHTREDPETGQLVASFGCQHSECGETATWQWQREATEAEIHTEAARQGAYGDVVRNMQGPHTVAVFACPEHTPKVLDVNSRPSHDLDRMALRHTQTCPAPDEGCDCG